MQYREKVRWLNDATKRDLLSTFFSDDLHWFFIKESSDARGIANFLPNNQKTEKEKKGMRKIGMSVTHTSIWETLRFKKRWSHSTTLEGFFSAVSKPTFLQAVILIAAFFEIYNICALLQQSNLKMFARVGNISPKCWKFAVKLSNLTKISKCVCKCYENSPKWVSIFVGFSPNHVDKFRQLHVNSLVRKFAATGKRIYECYAEVEAVYTSSPK